MKDKAYDQFTTTLCCKTRLRIIRSLSKKEKNVSKLSKELGINQTTLSHSLQILQKNGMVSAKRINKYKYYKIKSEYIEQILNLIEKHKIKYGKMRGE
jgi:predicted transcriptional regulator